MIRTLVATMTICGVGLMLMRSFESAQCMLLCAILGMQMIQDMKP